MGREREEPKVPAAGVVCQMVFPHMRPGQHMAFRSLGMPETHSMHFQPVSSDGHHDCCNPKSCHSILFHGLCGRHRHLFNVYQLLI